jgi:hypothetical protein
LTTNLKKGSPQIEKAGLVPGHAYHGLSSQTQPASAMVPGRNFKGEVVAQNGDGRAFPAGEDRTCRNWTNSTQGAAMLGHIDRKGLRDDAPARSWNSSHPSRGPDGGCSQADLRSTGGDGLFYCFAAP